MKFFQCLLASVAATSVLSAPIAGLPTPGSLASLLPQTSKWSLNPRHLFARAPTYNFQNCNDDQKAAIEKALANLQTLAGRILDVSDTVQSDQLVYRSLFGDPLVAQALNQDFSAQVAQVRGMGLFQWCFC